MKKLVKRFRWIAVICIILCVVFITYSLSAFADYDGVATRINNLSSKFPDGKYWDHYVSSAGYDAFQKKDETWMDSVTSSPCVHYATYTGNYDCNFFDGGSQCWGFANRLYYEVFGIRCSDISNTTTHSDKWGIQPGDHVRLSSGHSVFVKERNGNTLTLIECNYDYKCGIKWNRKVEIGDISVSWIKHADNWDEINRTHEDVVYGTEMTVGYDRVLPDGDYIIAASGDPLYFLDINGTAVPAADHEVVQLWHVDNLDEVAAPDIWTITYNSSNKFYKIKQKGTDMCLDVKGNGKAADTDVQAFHNNTDYITHDWAISRAGDKGYRIQSRSGGFSLDMAQGRSVGMRIRQWKNTESSDEKWLFIPYTPSQPIEEGRYILLYTPNTSYEVDVSGDTGNIANNTPVQIWEDTALSQFNSFDFIKLSNGYYKVRHAASGMCLDVTGGNTAYKSTVAVHPDNGSIAQQWAVVKNGDGYSLISRCNGYALDLADGNTTRGKQLEVYPRLGNDHQRWTFVKAERRVRYKAPDADGGVPAEQTKYYKSDLILSAQTPTRAGYRFLYWEDLLSLNENLDADRYAPGDTYRADESMELYAVWEPDEFTVSYDANGGTGAPEFQTVKGGSGVLLSVRPERPHYTFLGWATNADAVSAEYQPGDRFDGDGDVTLYAVWQRRLENFLVLPKGLTRVEDEAFLFTGADAVVIPAGMTEIGENAFGDVVIYGYAGSVAESWAADNGKPFVPITDGWVLADEVPTGARIMAEEWRYTRTMGEYDWVARETGVRSYANFPDGFDRNHALYKKYEKGGILTTVENNDSKTVYGEQSLSGYIFWHWTHSDEYANRVINDYEGSDGEYEYHIFHAFETTDPLENRYGMTTSGVEKTFDGIWSTYHYPEYSQYGPWWWFRLEVYQQPFTLYEKVYRTVQETSAVPVAEGDGISDVQHWVKYTM